LAGKPAEKQGIFRPKNSGPNRCFVDLEIARKAQALHFRVLSRFFSAFFKNAARTDISPFSSQKDQSP
jgi:hypothetical protein